MATFPALSTGAFVQHPTATKYDCGTEVIRFLDGSDQRCLVRSRTLRSWTVKLQLLSDQELARLEQFFIDVQGSYGTFSFIDPRSGVVYPQCRFQDSSLMTGYQALGQGATDMVVVEVRG